MKKSLFLFFIFVSFTSFCQKYDTLVFMLNINIIDTNHYYTYFNPNGVKAWIDVPIYDSSLIPKGGWAVQGDFLPSKKFIGYGVYAYDSAMNNRSFPWKYDSYIYPVYFLDSKKKRIQLKKSEFINYSPYIK